MMAEEKLDKDAVIRKASEELGVAEEAVRRFVERNHVDVVALYEEKRQVMRRKATHGGRLVLGGVTGPVRDFTIGGEVQP
jgi:hypothetical protein